tara:strand:+ start:120 stop:959 length:840 start_codon:yes stop_codon:yes gene_type:complete
MRKNYTRELLIEQRKRLRGQLNEATIKMRHDGFVDGQTTAVSSYYDKFPESRIANAAISTIQSLIVKHGQEYLKKLRKTKSRDELTSNKVGKALAKHLDSKLKGTKFSAKIKYLNHPTVPRDSYGNRLRTDYEYIENYITGPIKSVKFKNAAYSGVVRRNYKSPGEHWDSDEGEWASGPDQYENEFLPESFTFIVEFSGKSPFLDDSYKHVSSVNPVFLYVKLNKKKLGINSYRDLPDGWVFTTKMAKDMMKKGQLPKSKEYMGGAPKEEFGLDVPFNI